MIFIEKHSPIVVAFALAIGIYFNRVHFVNFNQLFDQLTTNSLSVSGTLVGFFLTILTIIHTINTRRMKFIKEAGLLPRLLKYLNTTIVSHIVIISITMFLPVVRQISILSQFAFEGKTIIIFGILLSWTFSIRFTYLFTKLLHDPTPKSAEKEFISLD